MAGAKHAIEPRLVTLVFARHKRACFVDAASDDFTREPQSLIKGPMITFNQAHETPDESAHSDVSHPAVSKGPPRARSEHMAVKFHVCHVICDFTCRTQASQKLGRDELRRIR